MKFDQTRTLSVLLLLIRLWLGYAMIRSGNCVLDIIGSPDEREFFRKWFGEELHFPAPVFMAILAKGAEFIGGILMIAGVFTRTAGVLIAFTMVVATLTANLGENFNIDGGFTISYALFALTIVVLGAGQFSLEKWLPQKFQGK